MDDSEPPPVTITQSETKLGAVRTTDLPPDKRKDEILDDFVIRHDVHDLFPEHLLVLSVAISVPCLIQ